MLSQKMHFIPSKSLIKAACYESISLIILSLFGNLIILLLLDKIGKYMHSHTQSILSSSFKYLKKYATMIYVISRIIQ